MGKNQLTAAIHSERGFTLLEVLISTFILSVALVALLHCLALAVTSYLSSATHWRNAVQVWNLSRQVRAGLVEGGEPIQPLPQARPLDRHVLVTPSRRWEVMRAQK